MGYAPMLTDSEVIERDHAGPAQQQIADADCEIGDIEQHDHSMKDDQQTECRKRLIKKS